MDAFQEGLNASAIDLPPAVTAVTGAFPEASGSYRVGPEEWTIRDQLLHLQNVELRYTVPNLGALHRGGAWTGWGDTDREPDSGQPIGEIVRQLSSIYDDRIALLKMIGADAWTRTLTDDEGSSVDLEEILVEECVQHDAEHLAQLIYTFDEWRKHSNDWTADLRAGLLVAGRILSQTMLRVLASLPEQVGEHRLGDEWSIREQVRHLAYVEARFALPNLRAIREGAAFVGYNAVAGKDDLVPDAATLAELRGQLRTAYDARNAHLAALPAEYWYSSIRGDRDRDVSTEFIVIYECVAHDAEHLSQLLKTVRDWRIRQGLARH